MFRDMNALWFICVIGVVLNGCTTAKNYSDAPLVVQPNYDRYYGQPQNKPNASNANRDDYVSSIPNDEPDYTPPAKLELNPNAPDQYTVKKGDTLWAIAGKFLKHPWRWPEIWDKNQAIRNPHLIYPDDVIRLVNGQLSYNGHTVSGSSSGTKSADDNRYLKPRIRIERQGNGVEPINTLEPFMVWPKILSEIDLKRAPYVLASRDNQLIIAQGDRIYLKNLRSAQIGHKFGVYHPNKRLIDPKTGRLLGIEATYGATVQIEAMGDVSTATVTDSRREIHSGDLLFPLDEQYVSLTTPISYPKQKVRGDIVTLFDAGHLGGQHMVAVTNQGKGRGIRVGNTLGIYAQGAVVADPYRHIQGQYGTQQPQSIELPPEKVADLVIYKVENNLSYGLIMDASREVKNGYKIGNP